jgi:hypothetical protein
MLLQPLVAAAELSAVNPDAMHDHSQPARQCHDYPIYWPKADMPTIAVNVRYRGEADTG